MKLSPYKRAHIASNFAIRQKASVAFVTALVGTLLLTACEKDKLDQQVRTLCAQDGGIRIYETVKLPASMFERFDANSIPSKADAKAQDEFFYESDTTYIKEGNPELRRSHHRIVRRKDGKVLGESIRYARRGGDMPGPWHASSFACPDTPAGPSLEQAIFQKQ